MNLLAELIGNRDNARQLFRELTIEQQWEWLEKYRIYTSKYDAQGGLNELHNEKFDQQIWQGCSADYNLAIMSETASRRKKITDFDLRVETDTDLESISRKDLIAWVELRFQGHEKKSILLTDPQSSEYVLLDRVVGYLQKPIVEDNSINIDKLDGLIAKKRLQPEDIRSAKVLFDELSKSVNPLDYLKIARKFLDAHVGGLGPFYLTPPKLE